jgi:hypothetical protein
MWFRSSVSAVEALPEREVRLPSRSPASRASIGELDSEEAEESPGVDMIGVKWRVSSVAFGALSAISLSTKGWCWR